VGSLNGMFLVFLSPPSPYSFIAIRLCCRRFGMAALRLADALLRSGGVAAAGPRHFRNRAESSGISNGVSSLAFHLDI